MKHLRKLLSDKVGRRRVALQPLDEHLQAAADWLLRAQKATPDDGVAHSYDIRARKWLPSYPETTGYIIPTFYDYARYFNAPKCADAAYRMAIWESEIQLKDGGVRAGHMGAEVVAPTIFNTGQVLFGWARAFRETGDERLKSSLKRAADWLVLAQDEDGGWRRYASLFTSAKLNSYNTRSAFGLVRAHEVLGDPRYLEAAVANVQWAIGRAHSDGWLPENSLTARPDDSALTHTIAYSIRGILEVGVASGNQQFLEHALKMARAVSRHQWQDGALPAYYGPGWGQKADWTCITGNSQMAINWLRLAQVMGDRSLIAHAVNANRFNMSMQDIVTHDSDLRGGLAGSYPINEQYMRYRYPNWAAKFFMDGLMLEKLFDDVQDIG